MALATQCPYCQTTFRVVHDQLKLRAGLVRCGSCKQIFNGIEHLLRPDQVLSPGLKGAQNGVPAPTRASTPSADEKPAAEPIFPPPKVDTSSIDFGGNGMSDEQNAASDPLSPSIREPFRYAEPDPSSNDPLQRMTLMDFTQADDHEENEEVEQEPQSEPDVDAIGDSAHSPIDAKEAVPDELDRAIEDLQQKPWRSANKSAPHDSADDMVAAESDEPGFVTLGRRRQRMGRMIGVAMWISSVFLLLGLIGQSSYVFRNQLAAWFPQVKPILIAGCDLIDCQVTLPMQADAVTIESSELQALAPQKNTFALTILMRNSSSTAQAWPNIELTLSDTNEKALVRRVFAPREYLPAKQDITKGFAASSEQPVKIPFELLQLKASGYRVYLYYP